MARPRVLLVRRSCATLRVRFDATELAVIDAERARLGALSERSCDRARALRSIVRLFGASSHATPTKPPDRSLQLTVRDAKREASGSSLDAATLNASLRARFVRSGLDAPSFCAKCGVALGVFEEWLRGRDARFLTLAKIARGLDEEGVS